MMIRKLGDLEEEILGAYFQSMTASCFIDLNYLQRFFEKHWCFLLIFAPIICPSVSLPQTSVEYTELQCYIFEHIQELLQFHDEENFKIQ